MTIARQQKGGKALSVITVDSPVSAEILDKLRTEIQADSLCQVTLHEQY
jgi:D-3-phosphoglycerate dehydrogenase